MTRRWLSFRALCIFVFSWVAFTIGNDASLAASATDTAPGVKISYQLPVTGPLPQTYRVTLAITSIDDPTWIISNFVAGAVRTVTAENQGNFTETWNGLDDNFMPVPAGRYGVKGIYMPAQKWDITGEYHTLIPKLAVAAGDSWFPKPGEDKEVPWINSAGFGTMTDVAIGKDGQAVFLHNYLENALNPYVVDLKQPIGHDQIIRGYGSGGTAGGEAVATDGELIWAVSPQGRSGGDIVYRVDEKPFGHDSGRYRSNVFAASGHVTSLAAWRNPASGARFLYVAQRSVASGLVVLDGDNGTLLKEDPIRDVQAVTTDGNAVFVLHSDDHGAWIIDRAALTNGLPSGKWEPWLRLDRIANPTDFKVDARGHTFVSDESGNQVYEFDPAGELAKQFGRGLMQRPGHYDDHVFMSPSKLALWTDPQGQERLIVVERSGPGRISEWSVSGALLRQWIPGMVTANSGYAVDPANPDEVYMTSGAGRGIIRFHVDYGTGAWNVDAVWPDIALSNGCPGGAAYPKIINSNGRKYLGFAHTHENDQPCGYMLYRLEGDRWLPSAGLVRPAETASSLKSSDFFWWNDSNGDGKIEESEYVNRPAQLPTNMPYWGDTWLDDLSLVMLEDGGRRAWRIAPSGFDAHGNPIFDGARWTKLLTDPVAASLAAGHSDPRHGGNELPPENGNTWKSIAGTPEKGFVVAATMGPGAPEGLDSTGRIGSQIKISRYVPDAAGGYRLAWRAGRKAFAIAQPGEIYGALHISGPINGLIAVQDGNGLVHVFTDDGLYVDTLFFDAFRGQQKDGGVYALSGELFDGYAFLNQQNDKVYLAIGRDAAAFCEVKGWTGTARITSPVTSLPPEITLTAQDTSPAPYFALRARAGGATQQVIALPPAPGGGPSLDGSLDGWDTTIPISFGLDDNRKVEIRGMYDPDTLYLHMHVRLPRSPQAADAAAIDRLFSDATGADTVSFYIQGDPATRDMNSDGRPGDVRFVCALVKDQQGMHPTVVGMYPVWNGTGSVHPLRYMSPVSQVSFAHVGIIAGAKSGFQIDQDGHGFTIAVAIPRAAVPGLPTLGAGGVLHTTVDFEATLGGKTKFWWSNTDGSASTVTSDLSSEARLYPSAWGHAQFTPLGDDLPVRTWLVSGPWGGPGRAALAMPVTGNVDRWKMGIQQFYEATHYPPDDQQVSPGAVYEGPLSLDQNGTSHPIEWRTVRSLEPDDEMHLAEPGALYFAAQWIWSPDAREIQVEFLRERQNFEKAWLNGVEVAHQSFSLFSSPSLKSTEPISPQTISLHAGWNLLLLRDFAVGYDLKLGVRLHDSPDRLWQLRLASMPPREAQNGASAARSTSGSKAPQ